MKVSEGNLTRIFPLKASFFYVYKLNCAPVWIAVYKYRVNAFKKTQILLVSSQNN